MSTTGILRSRRSAAQLHALASVEREIRANDPACSRKYLRDFRDAYRAYQNVLTRDQVREQLVGSDIALIGDYHALPNSQRYLASLIRDPQLHQRPLVLGLETIFSRDQHILDEWFRREIDENEFRQRIRFDLDWGYEWTPFFELLTAAREHAQAIYGLDCMPREDLRKIGARDRHAAGKIAEARERHPDALILVLFGESHLAPNHLPALVRARRSERVLTVLQNVDALYWQAAGEAVDHVQAVQVDRDTVCVFNATPLEKYETYRLYLNGLVRDGAGGPDLGPTVYNLVDGLVRVLGINSYSPQNTTQPRMLVDLMPEVYSRNSDTLLRRLLSRNGFTAEFRRSVLRTVKERGSIYLPQLNVVYVREFQIMSAAEDAARFLHHACRGLPDGMNGRFRAPLAAADAFYSAVLERAMAYFGSRVLHPARPAFRDLDLYELYDFTREDLEQQTALPYPEAIQAVDFLALHRELQHSGRCEREVPEQIRRGYDYPAPLHDYVSRQLGCLLGTDLYDAYLDGRLNPAALRKFFLAHIEQPGVASETCFQLMARCR